MKKILVIAIVCLLGSFAAAAQTVKVNGTIVDEQNRPVEFVNVALISLPDSSFVTESTTDGKGKFALRATAGSDFLLRLSYIGYVGEQIVIRTPQGTVQMGDIILKEQSVALDEVVISGSNITQKVDRMVVVPTATAMKNSYNPYDLMLNLAIPHLKVDALGKGLEANGGSVQTRINGIVATSTEVAALLPKEIVRIEFIENPGERYGDSSLALWWTSLSAAAKRVDWSIYNPLMLPTCCLARTMWWQSSIITSHNGDCSITCLPVTSKKHIRI